jgi:ParB family transcriptional regulator, chromosome partitioning protein
LILTRNEFSGVAMVAYKQQRLGRGLAALIGDGVDEETVTDEARGFRRLPIELLQPNPHNPRRRFESGDLDELVESIRARGVLQPLLVRPRSDGRSYEIVAGERRWRAAQRVPLHQIPVVVRELSDGEALEIALIENVQRADLNALEEAQGYAQLIEHFGYTQQQLAESISKSRSHIANSLRLLSLPDEVKAHLETGALTAGHARTLVASAAPAELAREIIDQGLSVREAEPLTQAVQQGKRKPPRAAEPDADTRDLERRLGEALGLKIQIVDRGEAGGRLTIHYRTLEQLDEVSRRLTDR